MCEHEWELDETWIFAKCKKCGADAITWDDPNPAWVKRNPHLHRYRCRSGSGMFNKSEWCRLDKIWASFKSGRLDEKRVNIFKSK